MLLVFCLEHFWVDEEEDEEFPAFYFCYFPSSERAWVQPCLNRLPHNRLSYNKPKWFRVDFLFVAAEYMSAWPTFSGLVYASPCLTLRVSLRVYSDCSAEIRHVQFSWECLIMMCDREMELLLIKIVLGEYYQMHWIFSVCLQTAGSYISFFFFWNALVLCSAGDVKSTSRCEQ